MSIAHSGSLVNVSVQLMDARPIFDLDFAHGIYKPNQRLGYIERPDFGREGRRFKSGLTPLIIKQFYSKVSNCFFMYPQFAHKLLLILPVYLWIYEETNDHYQVINIQMENVSANIKVKILDGQTFPEADFSRVEFNLIAISDKH